MVSQQIKEKAARGKKLWRCPLESRWLSWDFKKKGSRERGKVIRENDPSVLGVSPNRCKEALEGKGTAPQFREKKVVPIDSPFKKED